MRILSIHNRYNLPGGEDEVQFAECNLLRQHGHDVTEYVQDNDSIKGNKLLSVGLRSVWSQTDFTSIRSLIRQSRAEIITVHNFFPLVSPSVYYAAHAEGIPVVQTLHNFRLICPAATLLRDGKICEDCVGKTVALPAIAHACYRQSRMLTTGLVTMTSAHRLIGTWSRTVDRYIALTPFMKNKFIEGGFPADKITVKPNFTRDTGLGNGARGNFLYVGRLSPEKGVATLLKAWQLSGSERELRIVGTGPEELALRAQASTLKGVRFLGQLPRKRVQAEMGDAVALIMPSIWYEGFGLTIIEAFAKGTPVIASDLGAMASLVSPGISGYLFEAGNEHQLATRIRNYNSLPNLRSGARQAYEDRFTPEINYRLMMDIYASVIHVHSF